MFDRILNPDVWAAVPFHFWSLTFFVFGCLWGSFLNVCIYRMPLGKSVISPPSHCPHCGYSIPWYLNVPLVTWLMLRGRCANCRAPISIRYFLVELLTGVLFLGCWLQFGSPADPLPSLLLTLPYCVLTAGLIVASFIDFEHFIIPDEITIGGMVVGFLASLLVPALHHTASRADALLQSGLGIAIGAGVVFGILNGGKLLFGRKHLRLAPGSTITFRDTELELPGELIPLERVAGFNPADGVLSIPFRRAFLDDEIVADGILRVGPAGIQVCCGDSTVEFRTEKRFRLLEAAAGEDSAKDGRPPLGARLRRWFTAPPLELQLNEDYRLASAGLRRVTEKIPFEEMFFRKSDTLRLFAKSAEVLERSAEPYAEQFTEVEIRLSPERLRVGEREFSPANVPFMRVTTDSLVVPREAMGFGDVKFMAGIGAFLGWQATIFSLLVSAMIGSLVGAVLVLLGRRDWSSKIPYGPYIALAALIWMFGGRGFLRQWLEASGMR